jgi:outer membrane protein
MRSFLRAAPIALALIAIVSGRAAAQSGQKLAYITSSVLLEQAPGRADAEAQFERETGTYREQIKRMSDSLNAMVAAFEKRQAGLTAAVRETQAKDIQTKEAGYQARTRELEQKAQQRQTELVQPILDRVKQAIEDVRVEGGYSFIFNVEQGSPIVAQDRNLNVTDRVLAKLRSTTATTAKPATGAPTPAPSGVTRPVTPPLD